MGFDCLTRLRRVVTTLMHVNHPARVAGNWPGRPPVASGFAAGGTRLVTCFPSNVIERRWFHPVVARRYIATLVACLSER